MWLTVSSGLDQGKSVQAAGERFIIGRGEDCDLVLGDERVSRRHALLKVLPDGRATVHDLDSTNGTLVNGQLIQVPLLLHGGDQLQLGDTVLSVSRTAPRQDDGGLPSDQAASLASVAVAPAAPPKPPGRSTMERLLLRKSVQRTSIVAVLALVVTVTATVLFATGVLPPREPTTSEIVDAVTPSTVFVIPTQSGRQLEGGTGWVLDANEGLIVTNNHVVNGGSRFVVGVGDEQRPAELLGAAPCEDLAVLKVRDTSGLRTMPLGRQNDLKRGDSVVAVGFPVNASVRNQLTATTGVVSVPRTTIPGGGDVPDFPNVIQTDAAINPGNSGGPLVSSNKVLVGMNTFRFEALGTGSARQQLQNINYAIGVDRVKEITAVLRQGRSLAWTGMGLVIPAGASDLARLRLPAVPGIVVTTAFPGSPAEQARFPKPSLIVAIDGKPMNNGLPSYCGAVGDRDRGKKAVFSVIRAGATRPVPIEVTFA